MDRTRWWHADAAPILAEATPHVEKLQDAHLHCSADGRQLYSNEEGSENVPIPTPT